MGACRWRGDTLRLTGMGNTETHEYVMVDHCYLFYGQLSSAMRFIPPLDFLSDSAGWLGLRADGVVQFHTNLPLNGQRVAMSAHGSQVTDLVEHPRVLGVSHKALRARFGTRDRIVIFTGLKVGVTKGDRMLGHIPHVGHAVEAARMMKREGFGSGTRGREAAERWRGVLRGDVNPSELPVVHRWPAHPMDVAPDDLVGTEAKAA